MGFKKLIWCPPTLYLTHISSLIRGNIAPQIWLALWLWWEWAQTFLPFFKPSDAQKWSWAFFKYNFLKKLKPFLLGFQFLALAMGTSKYLQQIGQTNWNYILKLIFFVSAPSRCWSLLLNLIYYAIEDVVGVAIVLPFPTIPKRWGDPRMSVIIILTCNSWDSWLSSFEPYRCSPKIPQVFTAFFECELQKVFQLIVYYTSSVELNALHI